MPELSLQHIDQISRDINRQEIVFSHLLHDLIDHVCCDVENEMQNGLSFSDAYRKVKQKMGSRRLKEIQEETLYLVDTKYRYMKNTMKISGVTGTIMLGFAALFKIQHWPAAGIMMTLGALILAFIFLPSALGVLWKETHNRNRLFLFISGFFAGMFFILGTVFKIQHWPLAGTFLSLAALSGILFFIPALLVSRIAEQENKAKRPAYILGSVGVICYVAGLLFKIQHWPLAGTLMVFGVILFCILALPWYTYVSWKEEGHVSSKFLFMIIGTLLIIVPGTMVNLNLQNSYEKGFYPQQSQQQAIYSYLYRNNNSLVTRYHDSINYPQIVQLHSRTKEMLNYIISIQVKMVQESEGKPGRPAISEAQIKQTETGPEIQYNLLSNPFQTVSVRDNLLPGSGTRKDLDAILKDYIDYISGFKPREEIIKYKNLLDPLIYPAIEIPEDVGISLTSGLHSLELLKSSVLTVESQLLTAGTGY